MFVKTIKRKGQGKEYIYYQIVESYRKDGKVLHRIIANLGALSIADVDSLISNFMQVKVRDFSSPAEHAAVTRVTDDFNIGDFFARFFHQFQKKK